MSAIRWRNSNKTRYDGCKWATMEKSCGDDPGVHQTKILKTKENPILLKILSYLLATLFMIFLMSGCGSRALNGNNSEIDRSQNLVAILQLLASDIPSHRLTKNAVNGRLLVVDVSSFDATDIQDFILWAEDEFQKSPDLFVIITSENPEKVTLEMAKKLVGNNMETSMLQEWTLFTFDLLEYKGGKTPSAIIEMGVHFPTGDLVGAGYAISLIRQDNIWEITNSETTWIS